MSSPAITDKDNAPSARITTGAAPKRNPALSFLKPFCRKQRSSLHGSTRTCIELSRSSLCSSANDPSLSSFDDFEEYSVDATESSPLFYSPLWDCLTSPPVSHTRRNPFEHNFYDLLNSTVLPSHCAIREISDDLSVACVIGGEFVEVAVMDSNVSQKRQKRNSCWDEEVHKRSLRQLLEATQKVAEMVRQESDDGND
mmetsp:Transcript_21205/g.42803  ORF Transcript_21205/g.42803 Transcript_21205/m.42803 type:complete len:198 (-) Transcript_21205:108-701(-)|eukprot:CAMPEP_0183326830 /NCGR_PEP_ID=MMETSP0160_2-20130417/83268_1 /TAXON_ID=2839 ORGANISM="Odontella Sinensis, Strain Grunow 1884" /NCGR_SAMPLE_ID=MMETSP0160_2 /ASSEMBLY_ACC=CAM_ASM_000250 /LENGTH=197 /DNA_ID=CAMNT_0025494913 /DNA_START=90 /DNA_END=683 /DNA_ORIENTATION=-